MNTYTYAYLLEDINKNKHECTVDIGLERVPTLDEVAMELYHKRWHISDFNTIILDKSVSAFYAVRLVATKETSK